MKGEWAERYRDRFRWDDVHFGSHSVDCYPGGCSWRIFTRDGKLAVSVAQEGLIRLRKKN